MEKSLGHQSNRDRKKVKQRISGDGEKEYLGVGFEGLTVSRCRKLSQTNGLVL